MSLTGDDVRAARFRATKLREGYDQAEVDAFLDRVATALDAAASGGVPALGGDDVLRVRFAATTFREGYDQDDVDTFLDDVARALRGAAGGDVDVAAVPAAPIDAAPIDAAALREEVAALRPGRLRAGYEPGAVTTFLADAATELDRRSRGFRANTRAQEIARTRLPRTWWAPGFDRATVDALVRRVAASLEQPG